MFQTLAHQDERNVTIPQHDLAGTLYAFVLTDPPGHWIDISRGIWNGNAYGIRAEFYQDIGYILDECIAGCCDCAYNRAVFGYDTTWYLHSWKFYGD